MSVRPHCSIIAAGKVVQFDDKPIAQLGRCLGTKHGHGDVRMGLSVATEWCGLVVLAAGMARRYGGCKPLAPVGPHGEAAAVTAGVVTQIKH